MGLSIRAYARHRGVAHSAVQKALASGRIQPEPDGTINPVKADAQWAMHTRTVQPITSEVSAQKVTTSEATTHKVTASDVANNRPPTASLLSQASDETRGVDYHKARAVRETYAARLAKLDFEQRTGKLLNADEVESRVFNLARKLRDRLQQIPRKVAPDIVALVVVNPDIRGVTDILDAAIREALEELSR